MRNIISILLILLAGTATAQLTTTQLTQVQRLVGDSNNRERAFTRPGITTATTTNNTQNNRLGLQDDRARRDSIAIVTLRAQVGVIQQEQASLRSSDSANKARITALEQLLVEKAMVPNPAHFIYEGKSFRPRADTAYVIATVDAFKEKQVRFNTATDTRVTKLETWSASLVAVLQVIFKTVIPQLP